MNVISFVTRIVLFEIFLSKTATFLNNFSLIITQILIILNLSFQISRILINLLQKKFIFRILLIQFFTQLRNSNRKSSLLNTFQIIFFLLNNRHTHILNIRISLISFLNKKRLIRVLQYRLPLRRNFILNRFMHKWRHFWNNTILNCHFFLISLSLKWVSLCSQCSQCSPCWKKVWH